MDQFNNANAQNKAYLGSSETGVTAENSLMRLANQIGQATAAVDSIAGQLSNVALGIHGPRPEPVGEQAGVKAAGGDSLAQRISNLMTSIDRLQRSYDSIVR